MINKHYKTTTNKHLKIMKAKNPRTLKKGAKWAIATGVAIIAGVVVWFSWPKITSAAGKADLVGGIDNFLGWAPGIAMNEGLQVNKDSRMYKDFGLALEINVLGEVDQQIAALKSGDVDFIFTTTDISPIVMDEGSDLVQIEAQQFLEVVDSRGGDVLVVDQSITSIEQLRGKKIACALGWPSNTMLDLILKAGGLTENDVKIVNFASPIQAKDAYVSKNVDACVVWSPDNFTCMDARPSRELITTAEMPNTIVDVFVAKKSTLEKKKDAFTKLAKAWLTANAEVQNQDKYEWAAEWYKKAFESEDKINDLIDGLKSFRFTTYGDNLNFFGLNPEYTGITGADIYNKMARVYKNGYGNNLKNVTPWNRASNTSIIENLTGMDEDIHKGEGKFTFTAATEETKKAPAIMTKRMSVNFDVNSSRLAPEEERSIRSFIGSTANEFAGMRIRIEGNTDITGSRELNIKLSKERAQAVANYLINEYRFDPNRFIIVGNGPDKPIASNETEAGRAKNRRTDFEFLPAN